jgi:hypothetical protein
MTHEDRHYVPVSPPNVTEKESRQIVQWVEREFMALAREHVEGETSHLFDVQYDAPDKPRAGMLVYADGTTWNPGSGEGFYRYSLAGSWVFIG